MKWDFKEPQLGDAVRVKIGEIYHYGIFVNEEEIIQFGLAPNARLNVNPKDVEVCISDVDTFLQGGFLECGKAEKKDGKKRAPKKVVEYAKNQLGRKGYHILRNNCEHFVYECIFGEKKSLQTDKVRDFFASLPIVDVYTCAIPKNIVFERVFPKERQEEIEGVTNQKVKEEKYWAWKLLEYALMRTFGLNITDLNLYKSDNGKWLSDKCYFSLSHSHGVVAVSVSKKPVGVDIELLENPKSDCVERILTKKEKKFFKDVEEENKRNFLLTVWSKKESLYKMSEKGKFAPSKVDTTKMDFYEKIVDVGGSKYVLTVSSEWVKAVRLFENIDLSAKV